MATEATTTTSTFVWNELATTDPDSCRGFYTDLFGWTARDMNMGPSGNYTILSTNGKDIAGIYKMKPEQLQMGLPSHWMSYVGVEDVDKSADKARTLGGRILVPPMDIPTVGRFAVIADPSGAAIALFKPLPM